MVTFVENLTESSFERNILLELGSTIRAKMIRDL